MEVNRLLQAALAIVALLLSFVIGYSLADLRVEYVEKPVIRYVVETEVVEKMVETVVEKPVELRDFTSLAELEDWLASDGTDGLHFLFGDDGIYPNPAYEDCDDYAVVLQRSAEESGYRISVQVDTRKHHALNCVFIGNEVFFIEPQTDEVWLECYRD